MFLLSARVDSIAASAVSENTDLKLAIDTVVARIAEELTYDVPGMPFQEYRDYPYHRLLPGLDATLGTADDVVTFNPGPDGLWNTPDDDINADPWLADLEPRNVDYLETPLDTTDDLWGFAHISDLYGRLAFLFQANQFDSEGERISFRNMRARIVSPAEITREGNKADADGDGVADSRWIQLPDITSSKAKPIYAAVRIIDNAAMLNTNTGYLFDPCGLTDPNAAAISRIDGSSQMQVNLVALRARPPVTYPTSAQARDWLRARANYPYSAPFVSPGDLAGYEQNVVWQYAQPTLPYTPFDIGDELELRNRFLLNHEDIDTKVEPYGLFRAAATVPVDEVPYTRIDDGEWYRGAHAHYYPAIDLLDPNYCYRHIATTHSIDRIVTPTGQKMLNVNRLTADPDPNNPNGILATFAAVRDGINLNPAFYDVNGIAAQITVNLIDHVDPDANVTTITLPGAVPITYYGFEQPCAYISELARYFRQPLPTEPNRVFTTYAIELYKPYFEDPRPLDGEWSLYIDNLRIGNINWSGSDRFHVMVAEDVNTPITIDFNDVSPPKDLNLPATPNLAQTNLNFAFAGSSLIEIRRELTVDVNVPVSLTVDAVVVPDADINEPNWLDPNLTTQFIELSFERDITLHRCIRDVWAPALTVPTLGGFNAFALGPAAYKMQAHPANGPISFHQRPLTNTGQIGSLFRLNAYAIGPDHREFDVFVPVFLPGARLNLADPNYQQILNYLTVFDPTTDGIDNDADGVGTGFEVDNDELKIKGRININTAPWFVIAQLPWVSQRIDEPVNYFLAQAIVAYRDKLLLKDPGGSPIADYSDRTAATGSLLPLREEPGLESIAELTNVTNTTGYPLYDMRWYALDPNDLLIYPDLTGADTAPSDFEERDVIFSRISNLVSVRSDVFTAYILVRIGRDGPQKRVVAILDRSEVSPDTSQPSGYRGKIKILAVHPVPQPR